MGRFIYSRIEGRVGEIRIESLGVVVGQFSSWVITRRGDEGPGVLDLHAAFSYVNPHLWASDEYEKTITLRIGKEVYRIEQEEGYPAPSLEGRSSLRMQGVRLCQ